MFEAKNYEVDDFEFEFEPEGSQYTGLLITRFPELQPYPSNVDLGRSRSRNVYAKEAHEICGMNIDDLKAALISLFAKRTEDVAAAKNSKNSEEDKQEEEVPEEDINQRVGEPGVLDRFVNDAALISLVKKEQEMLKLLVLVCLSAQLDLRNGKPMGANNILTAEAGRGKNYLCDAVARLVPEEFCFAFESSSAKALYYAAEKNSAFFKHRWVYPNEAEGTDLLVEMFRPLLSGGKAKHITVNKDATGSNSGQQFTIEGPITLTIPTVRNKIDTQLQSRMLIADLPDYEGRVADHSGGVSELLSKDYAATDYTEQIRAWHAALKTLTGVRKVVTPVEHKEFRFDSDSVSHGARLWTNVLGLMCTHAWLEQRNREIITLENGEKAIVATPEDYEVAYEVFKATCERSVINLSDNHRKILHATYALREEDNNTFDWIGFSQRTIAERAGVAQSTVSSNKAFLVNSVKFMTETQGGKLNLVDGADPSWWEKDDALDGFPKPEQVRVWWTADGSPDTTHELAHSSVNQDDRGTNSDDRGGSDHGIALGKPNTAPNPSVIDDIGAFADTQDICCTDEVAITGEVHDEQKRIDEAVRECRELLVREPHWIPRSHINDEEALHDHAVDMMWASPVVAEYFDVFITPHGEETLKSVLREAMKSLAVASVAKR